MAINVFRGATDEIIDQFMRALRKYEASHPKSRIDLYRWSQFSVRLRVIDPSFKGVGIAERQDRIWKYLETMEEASLSDLSMLLALTPREVKTSFGNMEFEDPVPFDSSLETNGAKTKPVRE